MGSRAVDHHRHSPGITAAEANNPLIHLRVLEALHWHTRYGLPEAKQQAQVAVAAVPDTFDLRLTAHWCKDTGTHDLPEDEEVTGDALMRNHKHRSNAAARSP